MKLNWNILVLVMVIATFLMVLFVTNQEQRTVQPAPKVTPPDERINKSQPPVNTTVLASKEICEGCHMSGKPFIPQALDVKKHVNGGAYCLSCHTNDTIFHKKHPRNVTCEKCHGTPVTGTPVTIPKFVNGSISCNNCHAYPDPLVPSNGNIITIHRPRGISCNTCHTKECKNCHTEIGSSEKWEKRLNHFRVLLNMPITQ